MKGFSNRWKDFPDYIIGITQEIWEGRGVHLLHDWYAEDLVFRLSSGIGVGRQAVIDSTLATLAEFPDRQLLGEDVIWSGNPEEGMLSSHRIFCTATHAGHGHLVLRLAPNCGFARWRIAMQRTTSSTTNGWRAIRGAICRQMGIGPEDFARTQIEAEGGPEVAKRPFTPGSGSAGAVHRAGQ